MFILGIAPRVDAGLSSSELIAQPEFNRSTDILNQLTEEQLHRFASTLDELKVGGDGLGIVIALLVIAILVVILLQLTDHKIIVTK
jgi:hypothetical protein